MREIQVQDEVRIKADRSGHDFPIDSIGTVIERHMLGTPQEHYKVQLRLLKDEDKRRPAMYVRREDLVLV